MRTTMTQEEADFINGIKTVEKESLEELHARKENPDSYYRKKSLEDQANAKFREIYAAWKSDKKGEENHDLELFARKNSEWKQYCYKFVQRQKLVQPNIFAFQNKIAKDNEKQEPITVEISEATTPPREEIKQ